MIEKVKFKKLHENAVLPKRGSEFAGGWDVTAVSMKQISDDFVVYDLGFALEPEFDSKVTLVPRSSFTNTHWILQNSPGLGDSDFKGGYCFKFRALPIGVNVYNKLVYPDPPYKVGERIGQIYLEKVISIDWDVVDELNESERGAGGFGSSGK